MRLKKINVLLSNWVNDMYEELTGIDQLKDLVFTIFKIYWTLITILLIIGLVISLLKV